MRGVVSHDRHLLRTVADRLYLVAGGGVEEYAGDLADYASWLTERRRAPPTAHSWPAAHKILSAIRETVVGRLFHGDRAEGTLGRRSGALHPCLRPWTPIY